MFIVFIITQNIHIYKIICVFVLTFYAVMLKYFHTENILPEVIL